MKKILIIEDEKAISSVLQKKLEESGFEAITATDGETGLETALNSDPDLILLDLIMPKMDGMTLLEKYNQQIQGKKVPVIILSNLDSAEKIEESKRRGVYDYLVKTNWSLDDVVRKIKDTLGETEK